jgi:putative ABC transport system ATP-binding protein
MRDIKKKQTKKNSRKPIIEFKGVYKSFKVGRGNVPVLKDISLEIFPGEFVIIFGPSGCGKSTLLNTLVGLEKPSLGKVLVRGEDLYSFDHDERTAIRRKKFGIVYQQPNWIKSLNVIENVAFPLCVMGKKEKDSLKRASNILNLFRLEEFLKSTPTELSGGQQQRVSVTRALITNPWVIVADEPTGNLDSVSAADLMYVFQFLNTESKRTVIMVSHNLAYEKYATKIIRMEDGKIEDIKVKKHVDVDEKNEISDIVPDETQPEGAKI